MHIEFSFGSFFSVSGISKISKNISSFYHVADGKSFAIGIKMRIVQIGSMRTPYSDPVFKAVSEGITEFDAIAVCGGPGEAEPEDFCTPCGVCRQVLREFVDPNKFLVLLCKGDGSWKEMTLEELLPMGFGKENL